MSSKGNSGFLNREHRGVGCLWVYSDCYKGSWLNLGAPTDLDASAYPSLLSPSLGLPQQALSGCTCWQAVLADPLHALTPTCCPSPLLGPCVGSFLSVSSPDKCLVYVCMHLSSYQLCLPQEVLQAPSHGVRSSLDGHSTLTIISSIAPLCSEMECFEFCVPSLVWEQPGNGKIPCSHCMSLGAAKMTVD